MSIVTSLEGSGRRRTLVGKEAIFPPPKGYSNWKAKFTMEVGLM